MEEDTIDWDIRAFELVVVYIAFLLGIIVACLA